MIRVMVADDNIDLNSCCCQFLTKDKDIEVVSRTIDGENTIKDYLEKRPDVLLLDLNLPKMNGIDIINNLCLDTEERNKCNIIVVSGSSDMRYNLFNTAKVFRIVPKPVQFETLLKTIKEIPSTNSIPQKDLKDLLFKLKFNLYSIGTTYLISAINTTYSNPFLLRNMNDIYSLVAKKYNVTPYKIKWSIRSAIDTLNRCVPITDLCSIFSIIDTGIPITPKYFTQIVIQYFEKA